MDNMTERKRLPFTTVTDSEKEKQKNKDPPTVRFTLSLDGSNDQQCLEISYTDLVKKSLGEKKPTENGDDPFGDDEDQEAIAAIAKKFEEKYNPKNTKWKKKHGRIQDLVDLGDGYDETDDFIDNSEAYDEVIPACLTTKLGGFYINCGKLDFKEISDDSDDDFKLGTLKKKKKKRKIESDSESESEKTDKKIKKRKLKDGIEGKEKKKKKLLNGAGEKFKKPKKPNPDKAKKKLSPTVAELLKQQTDSTTGGQGTNGFAGQDGNSQSSQDVTGSNSSQDEAMDSAIDSVIAMSRNNKLDDVFDSVIGINDSDSKEMDDEKKAESVPKLPEGLSADFMQILDKIKEAAKCSSVGKGKFFTGEINELLLEVELTTRQLPCSQRSNIFGHLAFYLPCTKDTLLKRAKKLRIERQDDQLKVPLQKLKDAISEAMPVHLQKHEAECLIAKQKQEELNALKDDNRTMEGGRERDTDNSEEEGEKPNQEQEKKKVAAPKKKFEWNENLRKLLVDVVRVKMKIYDYMKTRTQSAEEYLKTFLDREIKPLWPKGWMQTSVLIKESRPGHVAWTNPTKIKKVPVINKTSNSAANTPAMPVKQVTTPSSASLNVSKQGNAPSSAPPTTLHQKSGITSGSTPVRSLGAGDSNKMIPTLLDYANEHDTFSSKPATDKSAILTGSKTSTGSGVSGGTSPGLSLLASSAASQKYMGDRSWDHVVSDILRSSLTSPTSASKSASNNQMPKQPDKQSESSFMAQFQKYASNVINQHIDDSKTSPPKSQHQLPSPTAAVANPMNQQEALQMLQKLKAAQMQKQTPPQAHQKSPTNAQLAAFLNAQKSSPGSTVSMLSQDAYKQFLENRNISQNIQSGGENKQKTTTSAQRPKPKTIVVYSSSASNSTSQNKPNVTKYTLPANSDSARKPTLVRSISQGSVTYQTGNQVQRISPNAAGTQNQVHKISPTSAGNQIQVQRISPTSANTSNQRTSAMVSPGSIQRHSPSKPSGHFSNSHSAANLNSVNKGEAVATNLLQSMFGQIEQAAHSQIKKSPSPSQSVNISRSTPPQNKNSASPIWSMNSIVHTQSGTSQPTSNASYSVPGMPKPVPGYQSIKLSSFKDSGGIPPPHSPTMKSLLHHSIPQGIPNHPGSNFVSSSNMLPGQQNNNSIPNQAGFFPPFTTQQSTYPYGSYYTGKSSNPSHGY